MVRVIVVECNSVASFRGDLVGHIDLSTFSDRDVHVGGQDHWEE